MKYMEQVCAETVIVSDDDYEEEYYGRIILGISNDQYVHYEKTTSIRKLSCSENDFSLKLEGYAGIILLPKHTGIDILTNRNIDGKIASPISIVGEGNVNLEIDKNSGLELCLETKGDFILNSELKSAVKDISGWYMHGRDFKALMTKCKQQQEYVINQKIKILDNDILTEYPKEPQVSNIDTCQRYNTAYINKTAGIISINYRKPSIRTQEPIGMFRDNIKYLHRALNKAVADERYEKAAEIQRKIRSQEFLIKDSIYKSQTYKKFLPTKITP